MTETFLLNPTQENVPKGPLRDFYGKWLELKARHVFPERKHFSPPAFASHIAWMAMNKYIPETGEFHVTVFGTKYADIVGKDFTGEIVEFPVLIEKFNKVIQTGQPYLSLGNKLFWTDRDYRTYDIVACPLFASDHSVSHILFRPHFHSNL